MYHTPPHPFLQFNSVDTLLASMKKLPPAVFMVADLTEEERKQIEGECHRMCTVINMECLNE